MRRIVARRVADLEPYARNPRTHSKEQVAQIAASIAEFGWTNPVLIDEAGGIIAGHGRVLAAKLAGIDKVPCIVVDGLTEAQRRALVIADNGLALASGWDEAMLAGELAALEGAGFDMGVLGFDDDELARLMAPAPFVKDPAKDPEQAPEPPANPRTRLGDVWVMGNHRIACGDATDAETVATVLGGATPALMVTDPPYGVEYDAAWRVERGASTKAAVGKVHNDNRADWREAWRLFHGDVAYVWHSDRHSAVVFASLAATGFEVRAQVVWAKSRMVLSRGHYHFQHEPCWYAVRKGGTAHWTGKRDQTTLWEIEHAASETGHSTQKPIEAMRRPIENNSNPGGSVYDPFAGSGTTIVAAELTGRRCYAIELSPAYVDVCVERWQGVTGGVAVRERDGVAFNDAAAA